MISLQQERAEQETAAQELKEALELRVQAYGQLECKYRQILQKFKLKDNELEKTKGQAQNYQAEKDALVKEMQQLKDDHKLQVSSLEEEKVVAMNSNRKLEEERDSAISETNKMRCEVRVIT